MLIVHLPVFFGEMSVQILFPFLIDRYNVAMKCQDSFHINITNNVDIGLGGERLKPQRQAIIPSISDIMSWPKSSKWLWFYMIYIAWRCKEQPQRVKWGAYSCEWQELSWIWEPVPSRLVQNRVLNQEMKEETKSGGQSKYDKREVPWDCKEMY